MIIQGNFLTKAEYVFSSLEQLYGIRWKNYLKSCNISDNNIALLVDWACLLHPVPYAVIDRVLNSLAMFGVDDLAVPNVHFFIANCAVVARRPYLVSSNPFFEMKERKCVKLAVI